MGGWDLYAFRRAAGTEVGEAAVDVEKTVRLYPAATWIRAAPALRLGLCLGGQKQQ